MRKSLLFLVSILFLLGLAPRNVILAQVESEIQELGRGYCIKFINLDEFQDEMFIFVAEPEWNKTLVQNLDCVEFLVGTTPLLYVIPRDAYIKGNLNANLVLPGVTVINLGEISENSPNNPENEEEYEEYIEQDLLVEDEIELQPVDNSSSIPDTLVDPNDSENRVVQVSKDFSAKPISVTYRNTSNRTSETLDYSPDGIRPSSTLNQPDNTIYYIFGVAVLTVGVVGLIYFYKRGNLLALARKPKAADRNQHRKKRISRK